MFRPTSLIFPLLSSALFIALAAPISAGPGPPPEGGLVGPTTLQADAGGGFSFVVTFFAGPDGDHLDAFCAAGFSNTSTLFCGDTFCQPGLGELLPGEGFEIPVIGILTEPMRAR